MRSTARKTLMAVTATFMLAAPAAQAMPIDTGRMNPPTHTKSLFSATQSGLEHGDLRSSLHTSSLAGTTSPRTAIRPAPAPASGGFDWLSAGFGAVAATALVLLSRAALGMRRIARA
jgi:hypothetical protein